MNRLIEVVFIAIQSLYLVFIKNADPISKNVDLVFSIVYLA